MALVVSVTQPTGGSLGDEWFNPSTNELRKLVASNGTFVNYTAIATGSALPSQTSNSGKYLTTDGTNASWATVNSLPSQSSNGGKYLTTDGTNASWATVSAGTTLTNETANTSSYYPVFTAASSGSISTANVSTTKLYFTPSTGTLNATVFNSISDETVKTNKERIVNALAKLMTLGGYTYLMIDSNEPSAGLLAQEVQKVLPEAVNFNPDTGLLSLNYNAVLGMVVEAINELEQSVSGLENGR
jgi:hypothetical protein